MKPKIKTETVLTILKIIALIAFFGYCVLSCGYAISFIISYTDPEGSWFFFQSLNLYELKEQNVLKYSITVAWLIIVTALKASVWYRAIQIIQQIKMENPFTIRMTRRLEKISYILLNIWILGYVGSTFSFWLTNHIDTANFLREQISTKGYLLMAGLLFIVSQIFRRGVELQSENDLTV